MIDVNLRSHHAVINFINSTFIACRNAINNSLDGENKNEGPSYNNELLRVYLLDTKIFFTKFLTKLKPESHDADTCKTIIKTCDTYLGKLDNFIDISIYKVRLTREKYSEMLAASEVFYYEGSFTWVARSFASELSLLPKQIKQLSNSYTSRFFRSDATSRAVQQLEYKRAQDSHTQIMERFGRSCQMSISSEKIAGKVVNHGVYQPNPFCNSLETNAQIIYVLDANDPDKIFQQGITYLDFSANTFGRLIYFDKFENAKQCAKSRETSLQFDNDCGWHPVKWNQKERMNPKLKIQAAIAESDFARNAPKVITEIVDEYLDLGESTTPGFRR